MQATEDWKQDKTAMFFGVSYTAPTPQEYTMQQLGSTLTKAYGMHLRKMTRHTCVKLLKHRVSVAPSPGFERFEASNIDDEVDFRQAAVVIA